MLTHIPKYRNRALQADAREHATEHIFDDDERNQWIQHSSAYMKLTSNLLA
jgi:hypothetical protein